MRGLVKNQFVTVNSVKSMTAQGWQAWKNFVGGARLETDLIAGKKQLGRNRLPVDGYDSQSGKVYHFHVCYRYGHDCSRACKRVVRFRSAKKCFRVIAAKKSYLRHVDHYVETVWECQWRKEVNSLSPIKLFLE